MNVTERRMAVLDLLQKSEVVELAELAKQLDVSTMTVRRDLQIFQRQGLISMNYGSAYLNKEVVVQEPSFVAKSNRQLVQKQAIGRLAAGFVCDDETIIIDCGTTPLQVLKYLDNKRVTVITNSMPVVSIVSGNSKVKLIFAPGEYYDNWAGVFGNMTMEFYSHLHADKVFMGAHGCSIENGATQPAVEDANTKRAIMAAGKEKFLLVDATKFDHTYLMQNAQMGDFDHVITDEGIDSDYRKQLEAVCRDVRYAGHSFQGDQ
jgi:DeoR/GlpR family transcriptional regulator of sugar metabolism